MAPGRERKGFTLTELLVVIGIAVILMAIIIPTGQRMREGNMTNRCEVQLSRLGQAMRIYYLDEQGVPPVGFLAGGDGMPADGAELDFGRYPGLMALFGMDYLVSREPLHCPRHLLDSEGMNITTDSPEYYRSYQDIDEDVKAIISVNRYKYMPHRWVTDTDDPAFRRQLATRRQIVDEGGTEYTVSRSGLAPTDDAVITWCNRHAESYQLNSIGQYIVLFWDGSVRLMDDVLFTEDGTGPDEAWRVRPTDIAH